MQLNGWGRYPTVMADVLEPASNSELKSVLANCGERGSVITRGGGRSYGDSALNTQVVSSRYLDRFIALDHEQQTLRCGAGVTLDQVLKVLIPHGLFPAVLPGTKYVSVGGAVAADIHGKNHHVAGSFCDHVDALTLMLANGDVRTCSPTENPDLFHASCGGMGLTGIIIDVTMRLQKVSSVFINNRSHVAANLEQCFDLLDEHNDANYVVAWLDCLAQGEELGRSIVYVGDHAEDERLSYNARWGPTIPFSTPSLLLNRYSMGLFNKAYFNLNKRQQESKLQSYDSFFFPLDNIRHWNRLYGRKGFLQYQFLLPQASARAGMQEILSKVANAGQGSFLSVLKRFGPGNKNYLSFPAAGYTLTLDFKYQAALFPLLDSLDEIVIANGGRHYLAKDARLSEAVFKAGYPRWETFAALKQAVDPRGRFVSLQSNRIGLTKTDEAH